MSRIPVSLTDSISIFLGILGGWISLLQFLAVSLTSPPSTLPWTMCLRGENSTELLDTCILYVCRFFFPKALLLPVCLVSFLPQKSQATCHLPTGM